MSSQRSCLVWDIGTLTGSGKSDSRIARELQGLARNGLPGKGAPIHASAETD